ncbi:carbamoyl phosphate synthase small subunit [Lactobacillus sp. Sy-1]|uniref:carbamoyl phosphate synthase small subunit n=1 Tax=Lactobacillus sp. Sy-1 TaxID=2109645 RepID=UPI001C562299|nr:carbamoyl phosphate synthase small subunit [Lactobacillus sp. Sy-1]MBW1605582.1 carbamoyl phosphate synthase small subunit [Lactobacillus sp. Sy-1]
MTKRYLILEDGSSYPGEAFGALATTTGEIIINSNMMGYQESITNPIYHNQIIVFTQPTIGNVGINHKSYESIVTSIKGVITREYSDTTLNHQHKQSLDTFLKQHEIPGIEGIDTRELAHRITKKGTMKASIVDVDDEHAFDQLNATVLTNQQVSQVATPKPYPNPGNGFNIIVIDFGLKQGILRRLDERDCNVVVVPWDTSVERILSLDPDGIVISTGPGNPADLPKSIIKTIQSLQTQFPLLAIGLGHELFAIANNAKVYKLETEHHGSNHPVRKIITNQVIYVSQAQGYAVDYDSIDRNTLITTYIDLYNGTVQGLRHRDYPAFSVQFSPDGEPGPTIASDIFDEFLENIGSQRR